MSAGSQMCRPHFPVPTLPWLHQADKSVMGPSAGPHHHQLHHAAWSPFAVSSSAKAPHSSPHLLAFPPTPPEEAAGEAAAAAAVAAANHEFQQQQQQERTNAELPASASPVDNKAAVPGGFAGFSPSSGAQSGGNVSGLMFAAGFAAGSSFPACSVAGKPREGSPFAVPSSASPASSASSASSSPAPAALTAGASASYAPQSGPFYPAGAEYAYGGFHQQGFGAKAAHQSARPRAKTRSSAGSCRSPIRNAASHSRCSKNKTNPRPR